MEPLPVEVNKLLKQCTALLRQTLGAKVEIAEYSLITRKHDYAVMRVEVRHPSTDLILKLAGPDAPIACPFEQSATLHRLVTAQTSLFVAEVFAADSSCQSWPWRYLIRTCVPGMELAEIYDQLSMEELADLHAQLGDAVAQLHKIRLPLFGEFLPNGEVLGGQQFLDALRARAAKTIKTQGLYALFLYVLEQHAELFADVQKAALCHEDLHRHNLLVRREQDRWQLATILDFDKAWAGCLESDLARLELWDGMTSDNFWRAYRAKHIISPLYTRRRPILQLMWCLEYAKQSERHLADTNRLCEVLGLPRIEQFA